MRLIFCLILTLWLPLPFNRTSKISASCLLLPSQQVAQCLIKVGIVELEGSLPQTLRQHMLAVQNNT